MANPFSTPDNEKSFSALVDYVVSTAGASADLATAVSCANRTVRECQTLGLFRYDMIEDQIVSNADDKYIWTPENPFVRSIRTVKYLDSCIYPDFLLPGKGQKDSRYYYYASDDYYVFSGVSNTTPIAMAVYYWSTPLRYYAQKGINTGQFAGAPAGGYPVRLAYYDMDQSAWMYLALDGASYVATLGDTTEEARRRKLSEHWTCLLWEDMIKEGTLTKLYLKRGDKDRAGQTYSGYKELQKEFQNTMGFEAEGF